MGCQRESNPSLMIHSHPCYHYTTDTKVVGTVGFEPTTKAFRTPYATRLRHVPKMVGPLGYDPRTFGLRIRCAASCAKGPCGPFLDVAQVPAPRLGPGVRSSIRVQDVKDKWQRV